MLRKRAQDPRLREDEAREVYLRAHCSCLGPLLGHMCLPINLGTLRFELAQSQVAVTGHLLPDAPRVGLAAALRDTSEGLTVGASQRWDRTHFDPAGPARPGCLGVRPLPLDLKNSWAGMDRWLSS